MTVPGVVSVSGSSLSCKEIAAIGNGAGVHLSKLARENVDRGRDLMLKYAAEKEVYGLSTGVGVLKTVHLGTSAIEFQKKILINHATTTTTSTQLPQKLRFHALWAV